MSDPQDPLSPRDPKPERPKPTDPNSIGPGYPQNTPPENAPPENLPNEEPYRQRSASPTPASPPPPPVQRPPQSPGARPRPTVPASQSPPSTYTLTEEGDEPTSNSTWRIVAIVLGIIVLVTIAFFGLRALFGGDDTGVGTTGATITISTPAGGTVLETGVPFAVEGMAAGLPEGNVVVQALDSNNVILAEAAATVQASDAETGGAGPWAVPLTVDAPPGTAGRIRAFSTSPGSTSPGSTSPVDGSVLAEVFVAVVFGDPAANNSTITIDAPQSGEVIGPAEVIVAGTATNAPEPNILVQALDSNNQVLASQTVPLGADGRWQATLQPNATPGTTGRIAAMIGSSAEQSVTAIAEIAVNYGPDTTVQPAISVNIPQQNETVSPAEIVVVGTGTALPENNVVVRVLAADGTVLAEQATTVDAEVGGTGQWQVTLQPNATPGTAGEIVALSSSPADGNVLAQASVDVTFGESEVSNLPAITIDSPQTNQSISPDEIVVLGTGTALPENNVVVRVVAADGTVLAEQFTTVAADIGGTGAWQVTLQPNATPGTTGQVIAFSPSPAGGNAATASVNVIFGEGEAAIPPAISISSPQQNETVSPLEVVVAGTGTALPENNVVVRVLAADGTVLAEQATTVDAEVGGSGPWQVTLQPNALPGTAGEIVASSTSPADGNVLAQASVDVSFGETALSNPPAITIESPQANETISPVEVQVVGTGTALPENNVVVRILAADGTILAEQAATVAAEEIGGTGGWQVTLQPNATPGTAGQIVAFSTSPADGSNVAETALPVQFGSP